MNKCLIFSFIFLMAILCIGIVSADKPEKITFIHYKDGKVKAVTPNAKPQVNTCYKLLGAKWLSTPVSYVINPSNNDGLPESFVLSTIQESSAEWDSATSRVLFNPASIDYSANWDDDAPDGSNELVFASYPQSNVIAVTVIWGYWSGKTKRIIEYDVLFNEYFAWGDASVNPALMDLQNIATHEIGHGVGLGDLYNVCTQETMYGYSTNGEISKRTLEAGDIAGIRKLYGA